MIKLKIYESEISSTLNKINEDIKYLTSEEGNIAFKLDSSLLVEKIRFYETLSKLNNINIDLVKKEDNEHLLRELSKIRNKIDIYIGTAKQFF